MTTPSDPTGVAGERACGERYGVQPGVCQRPRGHGGDHDDGTGQWPTEDPADTSPAPSPEQRNARRAYTEAQQRADTDFLLGCNYVREVEVAPLRERLAKVRALYDHWVAVEDRDPSNPADEMLAGVLDMLALTLGVEP